MASTTRSLQSISDVIKAKIFRPRISEAKAMGLEAEASKFGLDAPRGQGLANLTLYSWFCCTECRSWI
jgi:hypothetical protein